MNDRMLFERCQNKAFRLIREVTGESEGVQYYRYNNEPGYHRAIQHLAELYEIAEKHKKVQLPPETDLSLLEQSIGSSTMIPMDMLERKPGTVAYKKKKVEKEEDDE